MYSTPELFFTKDPRVPEQQKDLLISFTLPPELPKNWVRPWLGMAAIRRPIPTPSSTVAMSSTRICQRENIGRNLLISNDWDRTGGGPELPSEAGVGDEKGCVRIAVIRPRRRPAQKRLFRVTSLGSWMKEVRFREL